MNTTFVRALLIVLGLAILLLGAEFLYEWHVSHGAVEVLLGWSGVNNAKLVDLLSPLARAYNNILAMLLATIGLAIPLTANMHTPKLIDMFLRDRLNQVVLFAMALGAAHVLWVATLIGPDVVPALSLRLALYGALFGWILLIPYFFYVVRFLDPSNILSRLTAEVNRTYQAVADGKCPPEEARRRVEGRLAEIGTITLKSLDRADRGVALEGIWAIKELVESYGLAKPNLPAQWFAVTRRDFVGFSAEALEIVNEDHTWFEMKALAQAQLAYHQSLIKAPDVVSSISDALRLIALSASRRGDRPVLELVIRTVNSSLRESIKRRDVRSIYDIFYNYRLLARDIRDQPEILVAIARYFRIYADAAAAAGLEFIAQVAAFDLGYIVRRAKEVDSPAVSTVLDEALSIPHTTAQGRRPLIVKAKLMLGGFFHEHGAKDLGERVQRGLADVPESELVAAEAELLQAERIFFEVTDRQVNFEYLAPERREHVRAFVQSVVESKRSAAGEG